MPNAFVASVAPPETGSAQSFCFIFSGFRLLVSIRGDAASVPAAAKPEDLGVEVFRPFHLGTVRACSCYAAIARDNEQAPAGLEFVELRSLFGRLEEPFYQAALTGVHLAEWERNVRYCSKCRAELKGRTDIRAKECSGCGRLEFPRISPAIIVLIEKGDTVLLAHSSRFVLPFFSVLAGFVEPGESLESAVRREVMEETGIGIKNVRYFGSQPWPYPDSLMIGFTAEYESGEIRVDREEIDEAAWYRADSLPQIPGKLSIARQLIDWFLEKQGAARE